MLRLSPPGFERFFQSSQLQATFGGGEANVAVSLAQFGCDSYYVTRLPDNPIGDAVLRTLRGEGVRVDYIARGGSRLGIYFAEAGAGQRPSTVVYDRAHSAISEMEPGTMPWACIFKDAAWFHWSGITPALSPLAAECIREAIDAARSAGARISVDLNFRKKLWSQREAQQTMRRLVPQSDLVIANEEDLQCVLGIDVPHADVTNGSLNVDGYRKAAEEVAAAFAVKHVAVTLRESVSASLNGWSAVLLEATTPRAFHQSQHYAVNLVDRIGGGDSFAAGLIFGLLTNRGSEASLQFAVAASALKQTIPGDFNRVSVAEVDRLVAGDASGRVQR
jgi:2-dehydro-3-deoxygluconokinase